MLVSARSFTTAPFQVSPYAPPCFHAQVSNARAQMRMAALLESLLLGKVGSDKALDWLKYKQVSEGFNIT